MSIPGLALFSYNIVIIHFTYLCTIITQYIIIIILSKWESIKSIKNMQNKIVLYFTFIYCSANVFMFFNIAQLF